ncbi:MAG: type IV toxin-antitoxin system AbiEi family antitoxin domain-containing protein, partial [Candidatus Thermoplasmatota archaeon]|nr:type IV toxin-antitoxin system AbiEi family antitoxin domain-containing protein [Candidatus Thermoplasmatota archaeon]
MRKSLLAKRLAGLGETFTVDELRAGTGMSSGTLKKFLHRLESQGWVERIERGKYMLLPLGAAKGSYTLNEFVIGSMLAEPHCIAYWSALHHHGFTEQIPSMVFIQTTSRKKNRNPEIFGIRYRIIRIIPEKFFGQRKERFGDTLVNIADREKTLIDCLDKPQYCGGLIEAIKGLN